MSGKMTVSYAPRRSPSRRLKSPLSSWSFVGILLTAPVLLLPTPSGACEAPRFDTMKIKGTAAPSYNPGDTVEYECRPGYRRKVPPLPVVFTCQAGNTWSPSLQEACTKKSCPQLADPLNGRVNGSFEFGSQAHYTCNEGYYLLGKETIYCELSGDGNSVAWSDEAPQCEKILCQPPPAIPNGVFSNSHKDTFEYNEIVTYSCNPPNGPDEYSLIGNKTLICSGPNKWSSNPPECKVVKCPFPRVENGEMKSGFSKKYYYQAKVVFECNEGFVLQGSGTSVCEADSTWTPELPTCTKAPTSPPTTQSPSLTHSVSTPPGTKPPIPSVTGFKPSPPTTPPVSGPFPDDDSPSPGGLGGGFIALIVIVICAVIVIIVVVVFRIQKKKGKSNVSANYCTYQNTESTPAEVK